MHPFDRYEGTIDLPTHDGNNVLISSMKNQINILQDALSKAQDKEEENIRKSTLAASVLKNNELSDKHKLELLEFLFLTNK